MIFLIDGVRLHDLERGSDGRFFFLSLGRVMVAVRPAAEVVLEVLLLLLVVVGT